MTIPVFQCAYCKHYKNKLHCSAFRDAQIPDVIIINRHDHRLPFRGDNGIRFEPINEEAAPRSGGSVK